jgi:glycosyltransferase involved in cell wall biosynthesis
MKIAFILVSPDISGGCNVIFEHSLGMLERSHQITILTEQKVEPQRLNWHPPAKRLEWKTFEEASHTNFDVVLATFWKTAYDLHRVNSKIYAYFIQSIESKFYPEDEKPLRRLVDATYLLPLKGITEASWIQKHLMETSGMEAVLVKNGIRKDIFRLEGGAFSPRDPNQFRVLVEGAVGVPFKNVDQTIRLCRQSKADEIWLLTPTPLASYPGIDRLFSQIPIQETAKVYRSCDVIVKLSYVEGMFGPPLEMFHCGGTAIVYDVTGHEEYIRNGENAFVLRRDDEKGVIEAINRLKEDGELLVRMKAGAVRTAVNWDDWENASRSFEKALEGFLMDPGISGETLGKKSKFYYDFYVLSEDYRFKGSWKGWKHRFIEKFKNHKMFMDFLNRHYRIKNLLKKVLK